MYLKRYHDVTISKSGVWRILKRLDMGRLPASQRYKRHHRRWKRYEKQLPCHRVQIDVQFIEPLASMRQGRRGGRNKYYQFTAIDDCTRLRILKFYPTLNQATAIQFVDYVLQRLPFQMDHHRAPYTAAERKGRTHTPHRRRGVLPDPGGVIVDDAEVFNYTYHRPHDSLGGHTAYEHLVLLEVRR
ncbi:hypothetical protein ACFVOK_38005 [Streptomyces sp. NPDC057798]|uniref:hypothetical protein n=1 Tax=Streptomyces sp. NPDC057798 TaxID=3346252 RepID=UPI0036BEC669